MNTKDPLLENARKAFEDRAREYDGRILEVLKAHLSVEQSLNDLLRATQRRWRGRTFAGKIDVAQKLFLPDLGEALWEVLKKGNELRNAVAHGHKEGTITQRLADLRKALVAWSSPEQKPGIEAMTDIQMVGSAFYSTGSVIVVATQKLKSSPSMEVAR